MRHRCRLPFPLRPSPPATDSGPPGPAPATSPPPASPASRSDCRSAPRHRRSRPPAAGSPHPSCATARDRSQSRASPYWPPTRRHADSVPPSPPRTRSHSSRCATRIPPPGCSETSPASRQTTACRCRKESPASHSAWLAPAITPVLVSSACDADPFAEDRQRRRTRAARRRRTRPPTARCPHPSGSPPSRTCRRCPAAPPAPRCRWGSSTTRRELAHAVRVQRRSRLVLQPRPRHAVLRRIKSMVAQRRHEDPPDRIPHHRQRHHARLPSRRLQHLIRPILDGRQLPCLSRVLRVVQPARAVVAGAGISRIHPCSSRRRRHRSDHQVRHRRAPRKPGERLAEEAVLFQAGRRIARARDRGPRVAAIGRAQNPRAVERVRLVRRIARPGQHHTRAARLHLTAPTFTRLMCECATSTAGTRSVTGTNVAPLDGGCVCRFKDSAVVPIYRVLPLASAGSTATLNTRPPAGTGCCRWSGDCGASGVHGTFSAASVPLCAVSGASAAVADRRNAATVAAARRRALASCLA